MSKLPIFPVILMLSTILSAEKIGELPEIKNPHPMAVDKNELFVVDEDYTIHVYSLKQVAPKFTFGKKGENPEDFRYPPQIFVFPDEIAVSDYTKTVLFSREGKFIKAKLYSDFRDFDPNQEMLLIPVKDKFLRVTVDHNASRRTVALLDSNFASVRTLYVGLYDWHQHLLPHRIDVSCDKDKIFISDTQKGFFIRVIDAEGRDLPVIDKSGEVDKVPVTKADQEKILEDIRLNEPEWIYKQVTQSSFPEYYPLLHRFQVSDGKIYATTYKIQDGQHEMLILDLKGNILKRMFLPLPSIRPFRRILRSDLFAVDRGKLFELVKNSETQVWELHQSVLIK
jgi:hypothetical protein